MRLEILQRTTSTMYCACTGAGSADFYNFYFPHELQQGFTSHRWHGCAQPLCSHQS